MGRAAGRSDYSTQKRQAILEAGTRIFLRMGYEAAGMDLIAGEAGVAKQTLYNHFRSKEALFTAIVEELRDELLSALRPRTGQDAEPERVLESFGRQFLALMLRPASLALHRVLVAEAARFPDLAREIYAAGPERAAQRLAAYLRAETARGRLRVAEPALAAEQFFGMLTGHIQLRALFGVRDAPPQTEIERAVAHAVSSFLKAHAPALGQRDGAAARRSAL